MKTYEISWETPPPAPDPEPEPQPEPTVPEA